MESKAARALSGAMIVLLSACGGGAEMAGDSAKSPSAESPPPPPPEAVSREESGLEKKEDDQRLADNRPPPAAPGSGAAPGTEKRADAGEVAVMRAPMLIYTAQITMAVFEVNVSMAKVEALGRELGGFLAKRDDRSITIRVPATRFDEAVKRVEDVGDMLHRNVSAQDVTEEFRDLEIRLKSAHAVQQRLTELLSKAVKVEESIAIERELDRVSGEIERIEGRVKFLRDRAAFSTITVTFDAKPREHVGGAEVKLPVTWLYDLGLKRLLSL
jgi:hypothetical protein